MGRNARGMMTSWALYKTRRTTCRVGVHCVVISRVALFVCFRACCFFCVVSLWAPWPPGTSRHCRRSSTLRLAATTTLSTTTMASLCRTPTDGESSIYVSSPDISCYLSALYSFQAFLHLFAPSALQCFGDYGGVPSTLSVKFASITICMPRTNVECREYAFCPFKNRPFNIRFSV